MPSGCRALFEPALGNKPIGYAGQGVPIKLNEVKFRPADWADDSALDFPKLDPIAALWAYFHITI